MNNSYNQDFADNLDVLKTPKQIFNDVTACNATEDVIYWKARAMSLEIENARLKEMIHDIMIPHQSQKIDEENLPDREVLHLSMEQIHVSDPVAFVSSCVSDASQGVRPKEINKSHPKHNIQPVNEDVMPFSGGTENGSKLLYGPCAAGIRGMEVALKVNYERHLENPETVYWPNIPLKL